MCETWYVLGPSVWSLECEASCPRLALATQATAARLAAKFSQRTHELNISRAECIPATSYLDCLLITTDVPARRQLFAEPRLRAPFQKWNTNNGTVVVAARPAGGGCSSGHEPDRVRTEHVPQAFSHWTMAADGNDVTYEGAGGSTEQGRLLVCDIQGCYVSDERELTLNDPVVRQIE